MKSVGDAFDVALDAQRASNRPLAVLLAGHNGSGKSTLWYRKLADVVASWGLPDPSVYPCPDGEISSQWSVGPWEFDAVTVSGGHRIDLHAVHVETMAQVESRLGAGDAEQDLATFLAFIGSLRLPA